MSEDSLLSPYGDEPQVQGETCDPASKTCSTCLLTKIIRGTVAFLVLGTAGVYGAITVKPEVAEYFSFLPGMSSGQHECPIAAAMRGFSGSTCSSTSTVATSDCSAASACSSASRAALLESCSKINVANSGDAAPEIVLAETVFESDSTADAPAAPAE